MVEAVTAPKRTQTKQNLTKSSNMFDISNILSVFSHQKQKTEPKIKPALVKKTTSKVLVEAEKLIRKGLSEGDNSYTQVTQGRKEAWCANTVNYIYENALGKNIFGNRKGTNQYKAGVHELKDYGISNKKFVDATKTEGDKKYTDIAKAQSTMLQMKPGDIIIQDSYSQFLVDGKMMKKQSSHTGIVKEVKNGNVYVYEGNANYYKKDKKGQFLKVTTKKEGQNGSQSIGELQEVLPHDQFLLKKYSSSELVQSGYSGFIKMN